MQPTPTTEIVVYEKKIAYDRETQDFAMYLDGELVGFARTRQEAEGTLDALVYEILSTAYGPILTPPAHRPAPALDICETCGEVRDRLGRCGCDYRQAPAEPQALAEQLVGELNQIEGQWTASIAEGRAELAAVLRSTYDGISARVRGLGFELGPSPDGGLCLWRADNTGPLAPPAPTALAA